MRIADVTAAVGGSPIRREWAMPFGLFLLLILFEAMDSNAFGPIIAQIRDEFHLSATQVGLYAGIGALFGLLVTIPVGELIRRKGYRVAGATMSGFIFAGAMVSFIAPSFPVAVFGRIFTMSGTRGCLLVGQAGGTTVAPKAIRNTAWALLNAMIALGGSFGAFVLGGLVGGSYGWRVLMLVLAGTTVVFATIYTVFLRMPPPQPIETERGPAERPPLTHTLAPSATATAPDPARGIYKTWPLYALGLAFALSVSGTTVNATFASVVVKDNWGLSAQFTGTAIGLGQIISLPFMFLAGLLADRYLPRRLVINAFVLIGVSGGLLQFFCLRLGATEGGPALFMTGAILCYVSQAGAGLIYACVPEFVKAGANLGPAYAMLSIIAMSGYVVEPAAAGLLRDATGSYGPVFLIFGLSPLLGLGLLRLIKLS